MTNEELDNAREIEAIRIYDLEQDDPKAHGLARIAARLAREGWTPPVAVDPDLDLAKTLSDEWGDDDEPTPEKMILRAIKLGRELERAEAKPGMVWVKRGQQDVNPFDKSTLILVKFFSGDIGLRYSTVAALWSNVTHYAVITPPEDVA